MRRKVIKQGNGTLTITLPKEWTNKFKIKGGDEIIIDDIDQRLIVTKEMVKQEKRIEVDLTKLDFASIRHKMRSAYKLGYDEIYLTFQNNVTKEFKTKKEKAVMDVIDHEVNNLLGCEIIKQTKNSCLIKDYSFTSKEEVDSILRKIFLMMLEYGNDLIEDAKSMNKPLLASMREKHFNISKFIFYCLRTLNMIGYRDYSKTSIMYYILSALDDILDIEKYCAADLYKFKQKKLKKETIEILTMIIDEFRIFYEFYYNGKTDLLLKYAEKRWKVVYSIHALENSNVPRNELIIMTNMEHILELLLHLFEARMSLDCC